MLATLAHGFERGEVDNRIDAVGQHQRQLRPVADVTLDEHHRRADQFANALHGHARAVDQVVVDHDLMAAVDQCNAGVATDVPHTATDQDFHSVLHHAYCPNSFLMEGP